MLKGGSRSPKYSAYMEVSCGRCKRYASGSTAATAQRRASHRAHLQVHAAGLGPLGEAGIPGGRARSGGLTAPQEMREAERESARAARGGAARVLVWGHRKRAGRQAPEHWTGPQMS